MRPRSLLRALATLAAFTIAQAAAAPVVVGNLKVELPAPEGMVQLPNFDSPYARDMAASQVAAKGKPLAIFLPPADARVALDGRIPEAESWAVATVPDLGLPFQITAEIFQRELIPMLEKNLPTAYQDPKVLDKINEYTKLTDQILAQSRGTPPMSLGGFNVFGVVTKTPRAFAYSMGTTVAARSRASNGPILLTMCTGWFHVPNQPFAIAVYRIVEKADDIRTNERVCASWLAAIAKANP